MNPPSRPAPPLPPHEAVQHIDRPARHQYGRVPGTTEAVWIPPTAQAPPPPIQQISLPPDQQIYLPPNQQTSPPPNLQAYPPPNQQTSFPPNQQAYPPPNQQTAPTRQTQQPPPQPSQEALIQTWSPESYQSAQQTPVYTTLRPQLPPYREPVGYDPRLMLPQQGQQRRSTENKDGSQFARRAVSSPLHQQSAPQNNPYHSSQTTVSPTGQAQKTQARWVSYEASGPPQPQPQRTELPLSSVGAPQNRQVSREANRPPLPQSLKSQANRSTSQPPGPRNVRQPSPQSQKLHKASQPDIRASQWTRSTEASPLGSPALHGRGRSESITAIPTFGDLSASQNTLSRPNSYHSDEGNSDGRGGKLKGWIPGRSRPSSQDLTAVSNGPGAWLIAGESTVPYSLDPLLNAKKVNELWDDSADTFVYLFHRDSGRGPSFRIPSAVISSSPKLRVLAFGESQRSLRERARSFDGRSTLSANDATRFINMRTPNTPPYTPTMAAQDNQTSSDGSTESISSLVETVKDSHLYFPRAVSQQHPQEEHDHLISARNLFAFLTGRPLIATKNAPTVFSVLCVIANQLKEFEFSNVDGSTYGEAAVTSLNFYIENLGLTAVATSREKTLEGIVLGERLRSMDLYNEAFTHAVGKYEAVRDKKSLIWDMITEDTRNRMERAFMDLEQRQQSVQIRLTDFEFPSLFAGFGASTSSAASKVVRFRSWKSSFLDLRKHILSYYKDLYGNWPPKAKSKKNRFSLSGLNRLVLKTLYADFCTLYDLLVDRESLTNRSMDIEDTIPEGEDELVTSALRRIESEYDHSCPPVQPPVPFDTPIVPTMVTLDPRHKEYSDKVRLQSEMRRLQPHEVILILTKSRNLDSDIPTPFLKAFRAMEEKEARGKTAQELADQRYGYWLFVYVVLQALPMLVIDAPELKNTDDVEYFLCEPPIGGAPWVEDASIQRRAWYGVIGGERVVAMPSDIVDHGVEATYRRSHCWVAAEKWLEAAPKEEQIQIDSILAVDNGRSYDIRGLGLRPEPLGVVVETNHEGSGVTSVRSLPTVAESVSSPQVYETDNLVSAMSPSTQYHHRPRARSALDFGLEQLAVPPGYNMSPRTSPHMSPHISPPLEQGAFGSGVVSPNDTLSPLSAASTTQNATKGMSFDQILNQVEKEKEKKEKNRRKSFIGLGIL